MPEKLFKRLRERESAYQHGGTLRPANYVAPEEAEAALELLAGLLGEDLKCRVIGPENYHCGHCFPCRARAALDSLGWTKPVPSEAWLRGKAAAEDEVSGGIAAVAPPVQPCPTCGGSGDELEDVVEYDAEGYAHLVDRVPARPCPDCIPSTPPVKGSGK